MKRKLLAPAVAVGLLSAGLLAAGHVPQRASAAPAHSRAAVVVELFTSEGCSSCPPADAVLSELIRDQPVSGAQVIALGEHVDYWNHNGWADPFSSHTFSDRQSGYSDHFKLDSVYTPQMIVDGRTQFVGSDRDQAISAITRAASAPEADISISRTDAGQGTDSGSIPIAIHIDHLPPVSHGDTAAVEMAVTEDGLQRDVQGGENAGRTLRHSAVVRELRTLSTIPDGATSAALSSTIAVAHAGDGHPMHVVVFVQEENSRRILGAATLPV